MIGSYKWTWGTNKSFWGISPQQHLDQSCFYHLSLPSKCCSWDSQCSGKTGFRKPMNEKEGKISGACWGLQGEWVDGPLWTHWVRLQGVPGQFLHCTLGTRGLHESQKHQSCRESFQVAVDQKRGEPWCRTLLGLKPGPDRLWLCHPGEGVWRSKT